MLIDFHTHVFPDAMAERTIAFLASNMKEQSGFDVKPFSNGSVSGCIDAMDRCGVSISVTMPIATKPSQTESINNFSKSIRSDRLIPFGAIHPENDDIEGILEALRDDGFLGIKLHPEYQSFYFDSRESIRILKAAEKLGLYVTVHAGADAGTKPPVHCTSEHVKNVLTEVEGSNIILAHMGGFKLWDEVEKELIGTNVMFDTAVICLFMDRAQSLRMIKAHGSEKILFGSDCPWASPLESAEYIKSLALPDADEENILYKNALRILKI